MKTFVAVAAILGALGPLSIAGATDLVEIYELALANDPLLKEAEANRLATLESKPQALAGLLPQINLTGFIDDNDSEGRSTQPAFIGAGLVTTQQPTDLDRRQWQVQLSQPLFRFDRWIALKRADKQIAQQEANFAATQQDLAVRVAQTYFDVLAAEDSLEAETANKEAIARQLEQAETRFEVGLIAITDVHESRAAYDQSVAAEIGAKRALATAREGIREITGTLPGTLAKPGEDLPMVSPDPADQEQWVRRGLEKNLNIEASRLAVEIAGDDVKSQRTGHYPTLDLVLTHSDFDSDGTRYNVVENPAPGTNPFSGGIADSESEADTIALQFSVPLYSGGAVSSRVRQAVYSQRAARQSFERVARETERQTRDAYLGVLSEVSRVKALAQAVTSSETALKATEAGFDVGTRTSVDVLNARGDLLRARTNYRRARYDYLLNVTRLKQAAGSLSMADLREINQWLKE